MVDTTPGAQVGYMVVAGDFAALFLDRPVADNYAVRCHGIVHPLAFAREPGTAREFVNWTTVRDAIESAYAELGLSMVKTESGSSYPAEHWNLAGLVRDYVMRTQGSCVSCSTPLNFHSVIRCLDCRSMLCEACAPSHFGPAHGQRATAAHGAS